MASSSSSNKKYKLFSSANGAEKAPCAFFASAKGCRNGDNCKFSHELAAASPPSNNDGGSVISSESEAEDNNTRKTSTTTTAASPGGNPFLGRDEQEASSGGGVDSSSAKNAPSATTTSGSSASSSSKWVPLHRSNTAPSDSGDKKKKTTTSNNNNNNISSNKKTKNRRGKNSLSGENLFVNPKGAKKARTQDDGNPKEKPAAAKDPVIQPPATQAAQAASKKQKSTAPTTSAASNTAPKAAIHPAFGSLNLPVAPFSCLKQEEKKQTKQQQQQQSQKEPLESGEEDESDEQQQKKPSPHDQKKEKYLNSVWPDESNEMGRKWLPAVRQTRQHFRYLRAYDFEKFQQADEDIGSGGRQAWIQAAPKSNISNKNALPAAIAIDCEMCETQDPVSKKRNPRALCRISIINAETDEVLLDSLVKPAWPVINHRSWINGISKDHLETVQFTLRHAQAFFMQLLTPQTVIIGHAVHNDLAALRLEHYCVVDSACLFHASDSDRATVSLKDMAWNILKTKMPETHDSVNDARVALRCLEHYVEKNGQVEKIVRSNGGNGDGSGSSNSSFGSQLFVHRIPRKVEPEHLMKMFLEHSSIEPVTVKNVEFPNPRNDMGKTIVIFRSNAHANLAFDTLAGKPDADPSGRLQKKVFMKNGSYIRVRKMAYEPKPRGQQRGEQESSQQQKRKRSDSM